MRVTADKQPVFAGGTPQHADQGGSMLDFCASSPRSSSQIEQKMTLPTVAIIIVGFRNADDIVGCLRSLGRATSQPSFEVFIAENGGAEGMAALEDALTEVTSPCQPAPDLHAIFDLTAACSATTFRLRRDDPNAATCIHVAEMPENLGYAGAINAWLRPLMHLPGWQAVWVLNPDTEPAPSALFELADHAARRNRGMVGSRITTTGQADQVRSRGLQWRKFTARTTTIDFEAAASVEPDPEAIEARLDAPSGASLYITRDLIDRIGLMDERYFLYFEDLEWGCRAKALGMLGYAHRSVVPHKGGTTIGSASNRASRSRLAVYLEFRNRILFVRDKHIAWLPWTALMQSIYVAAFIATGSFANMLAAGCGLLAGLRGEVGRPDWMLKSHEAP
jgi:GT2 family glycosyltransferase